MQCYLLSLSTIYNFCGAKKFKRESKSLCCCDGIIQLKMNVVFPELYHLFTSSSNESVEFMTYIRSYNCNFSKPRK